MQLTALGQDIRASKRKNYSIVVISIKWLFKIAPILSAVTSAKRANQTSAQRLTSTYTDRISEDI